MFILSRILQKLKTVMHCAKGVALIEFAIVLPVLLLLFLGATEVARYIFIVQKIEAVTSTIGDVVTQSNCSSTSIPTCDGGAALKSLLSTTIQTSPGPPPVTIAGPVPTIMQPYSFTGSVGFVMVTYIYDNGTASETPTIGWRYCGAGKSFFSSSRITLAAASGNGGTVSWAGSSAPITLGANGPEDLVVTETFYNFTPLVSGSVIPPVLVYRATAYTPRYTVPNTSSPYFSSTSTTEPLYNFVVTNNCGS